MRRSRSLQMEIARKYFERSKTMENKKRLTRNLLIAGAGILVVLGVVVWMQIILASSASSSPSLDDQTLTTKAVNWAQIHGLQGTPVATRAVRMTLGQWLAIGGGQLSEGAIQFGLSPDTLVFVLAIRGRVEWRGPGSSLQGQDSQKQFDNITVVLDARSGSILSAGTVPSTSTMPIPVPLNTLTPAAPIIFGPTKPPRTPPTLVPRVTVTRPPTTPTLKPYP